jgi:citrate lyase subunit beta/citryl-CoA lyase
VTASLRKLATARSFLFVPGTRPERFAKARESGAHAVILDLEDAVAPADKDRARQIVGEWLDPRHPVLVRINGAGTPWFAADLALCGRAGLAGIVLPKAELPVEIAKVHRASADGVPVLPIVK